MGGIIHASVQRVNHSMIMFLFEETELGALLPQRNEWTGKKAGISDAQGYLRFSRATSDPKSRLGVKLIRAV